ncbi:MAG: hypothetical protein BRD36_01890 [Bacteroidetes bacterium QH_7_64_110]|nr:MAG: hypothetical protein BRD36_01890 [Bacteroidetes bacterium QH_7_64_110]
MPEVIGGTLPPRSLFRDVVSDGCRCGRDHNQCPATLGRTAEALGSQAGRGLPLVRPDIPPASHPHAVGNAATTGPDGSPPGSARDRHEVLCRPRRGVGPRPCGRFVTCGLEFLQLWRPPTLQTIRQTFLGRVLIGAAFDWWDLVHYGVGAVLGVLLVRKTARATSDD